MTLRNERSANSKCSCGHEQDEHAGSSGTGRCHDASGKRPCPCVAWIAISLEDTCSGCDHRRGHHGLGGRGCFNGSRIGDDGTSGGLCGCPGFVWKPIARGTDVCNGCGHLRASHNRKQMGRPDSIGLCQMCSLCAGFTEIPPDEIAQPRPCECAHEHAAHVQREGTLHCTASWPVQTSFDPPEQVFCECREYKSAPDPPPRPPPAPFEGDDAAFFRRLRDST